MDMKLTLKKNRKFKKKTISSKAKKRDIYSENAIMPIGKMVGGAVPPLDRIYLPNGAYLQNPNGAYLQNSMQGAITKYPSLGNWIDVNSGTYTLKSLKAVDAVKDGAPNGGPVFLADTCFGTNIASSRKSPTTLKEFVKKLFDQLVESNELKYIPYTRIKNKIVPAPELPEVHYDYYIPDCGPTYSQYNGKTPEVLTSAGGYPQAIYSLGNKLDTGPSSSNQINLHCNNGAYTIHKTTMEVLGYNNLEIEVTSTRTNPIDYNILFTNMSIIRPDTRAPATKPSNPVIPATIGNYAVGNANKKLVTSTSILIDEKTKYLFIKSLGDTLIVYHWLWACLSTLPESPESPDKKISLLTCDSVVALQAFILGHTNDEEAPFLQNAQFALNYTEKGENHISKVYYKGQPPDYETLFKSEKDKIIQRYHAEIYNFEKNIKHNGFTFGENKTYVRPNLIQAIIDGLIAQIVQINSLDFEDPEDYKTLKGYELMPLIRSKKNDQFVLIRGRNKFSVNDTTFLGLGLKNKPMPLEYLVTNNIFEDDTRLDYDTRLDVINGGSVYDNTSKMMGGRNDDDEEGEYYYKIGLYNSDNMAIRKLQRFINNMYHSILSNYSINAIPLNTYLNKLGIISSSTTNKYNNVKKINPYNNVEESPYNDYLNVIHGKPLGTQIYDNTYGGDSGTLYEILTYYFHVNPDYTRKNIRNLIKEIFDDYLPYAREYNRRPKKTVINSRRPRKTVINSRRPRKTVRIRQSDGNARKTSSKSMKTSSKSRKTSSKSNKTANISKAKASKAASKAAREINIMKKRLTFHMDESK
jgi:hypothetical protein